MTTNSPDQTDDHVHPHPQVHPHSPDAPRHAAPAPAEAHERHDHAGYEDDGGHDGHDDHASHSAHDHGDHGDATVASDHTDHADHADHADHDHSAHDHTGHDHAGNDHSGHDHSAHDHSAHVGQFRRLFWIMLVIAAPVVVFSPMFAMLVGYEVPAASVLSWVSPVLGTVMYVWGGRPFLVGGVAELRARRPGMMLLIALAITVGFVASWGASLGLLDHQLDFWWELALLVVVMLLGHWIEMRAVAQTSSALDALAALLPDRAERVTAQGTESVDPATLRVGDVVVVRPGGRVPADGRVVSGTAAIDESMITGESRPVTRSTGDAVVAGTVATDSGLRVEVTAVGDDTALAGIARLVAEAQRTTTRAQRIADRAAAWLFWFALTAAVVTAVVWTAVGLPDDAVVRAITVLVIACPHALGLAIPLVVSIATGLAARAGILVTDRLALESMRTVDVVVFDKTGTLTAGTPEVTALDSTDENRMLRLAAAAESESEHPLARAIVAAAEGRGIRLPEAHDIVTTPGVGVVARVEGHRISVGGPALLAAAGLAPVAVAQAWSTTGSTVLHVVVDGSTIGAIALDDAVRPTSRQAVAALRERGVDVVMLTGDAEPVAARVAAEVGITRWIAGVRPEDKAAEVARLRADGHRVAMVGDGVNDAPALAGADVGIAIGAGTDVAIASAGVVLAGSDPRAVVSVIDLSRASYRKMVQNLWWAAGYNLVSVPLAAGVLAPIGFVLPMAVGAVLMSLSTIVVAANAQLLRRLDLRLR
ncbi:MULTISPECIES: heavy metal translocating P-type ATPase [Microbacterium]|nr:MULTISPECIES: heavy metal translocating P-type ATPase [unclassified Microbacterium]